MVRLKFILALGLSFGLLGCKEVENFAVSGGDKLSAASFGGKNSTVFTVTSPTAALTVTANCDIRFKDYEISKDMSTWSPLATEFPTADLDCTDKTMSFSLDPVNAFLTNISGGSQTFWIRAKTILGTSDLSTVTVLLDVPATLTASIARGPTQVTPTKTSGVTFQITFNQSIDAASFTASDITESGTYAGSVTWGAPTLVSGNTYQIVAAVSGVGEGTIKPTLAVGSVSASGGAVWNVASTSSGYEVQFDNLAPAMTSLALSSPATSPGSDSTPTFEVQYAVTSGVAQVQLFDGSGCTSLHSTSVSPGSTSTLINSSVLSLGSYTFGVKLSDALGNQSVCLGAVSYEYIVPASVSFSTTSHTFPNTTDGATSDVTITVTVTGSVSATSVSATGIAAPFAFKGGSYPGTTGDCPPSSIAPGTCTMVLTYAPTSTGTQSDQLDLNYSTGLAAATESITLQGTGVSPASISISGGPSLDFGTRATSSATTLTLTLYNSGASTASSVSTSGLLPPFSVASGGDCGSTLSAGATCNLNVRYSPTAVGASSDTLVVSYFDGASPRTAERNLDGTAANPAVLSISDSPGYDFGKVEAGLTASKTFTVTNSGGVPATDISLDNLSTEFSRIGGNCSTSLASAGATCSIIVEFSPTIWGTFNDTIVLNYNNGAVTTNVANTISGDSVPVVKPVYPSAGANWMDYVVNSGGTDELSRPDSPCSGTELGYWSCLHGGEMRKVVVPGYASCANLTIADNLSAFDWVCKVDAGTATFFSKRLSSGKGLRDLILSSSSWKSMTVTVNHNSSPIGTSQSLPWWSNSVMPLPDNSNSGSVASLFSGGAIYVLTASRATRGYDLTIPKIGIVTLGSSELSWPSSYSSPSCNATVGGSGSPSLKCILTSNTSKFHWIEISASGEAGTTDPDAVIFVGQNSNFTRVHNSTIKGGSIIGSAHASLIMRSNVSSAITQTSIYSVTNPILLISSNYNLIKETQVASSTHPTSTSRFGVRLTSSSNNRLIRNKIVEIQGGGTGLKLDAASSNNIVEDLTGYNTAGSLVTITGNSNGNLLAGISGGFTGDAVVSILSNSQSNFVHHLTSHATVWQGVFLDNSSNNYIFQTMIGNTHKGIETVGTTNNTHIAQIAIGNSDLPVWAAGYSFVTGGKWWIYGSCSSSQTTGFDSSCGGGSHSLESGLDLSGSVYSGTLNTHPYSALSAPTSNWLNLSNWFQFYGKYASIPNIFDSANRGHCLSGATCASWDVRILNSHMIARRSYGDSLQKDLVSDCTQLTEASQTLSWAGMTFYMNAREITADGSGNDNTLCEAGEDCIWSPHIGAFQGENGLHSSDICSASHLTGTRLFRYSTLDY